MRGSAGPDPRCETSVIGPLSNSFGFPDDSLDHLFTFLFALSMKFSVE